MFRHGDDDANYRLIANYRYSEDTSLSHEPNLIASDGGPPQRCVHDADRSSLATQPALPQPGNL